MGFCGSKSNVDSGQLSALGADERQQQQEERRRQREEQRQLRKRGQHRQKQQRQHEKGERRRLRNQLKEERRQQQPSTSFWQRLQRWRRQWSASPTSLSSNQQPGRVDVQQSDSLPEIPASVDQAVEQDSTGPSSGLGQIDFHGPNSSGLLNASLAAVGAGVTGINAVVKEGTDRLPKVDDPYSSGTAQAAAVRTLSVHRHQPPGGSADSPQPSHAPKPPLTPAPSSLPSTERNAARELNAITKTPGLARTAGVPPESEVGLHQDGQEVTISTSSTKVEATPTAMSTTETLATSAPLAEADGHTRDIGEQVISGATAQAVPFPSSPTSIFLHLDVGPPTSDPSAETMRRQALARARLDGTGGTAPPAPGAMHAISLAGNESVPVSKQSDGELLEDLAVSLKFEGKEDPPSPPYEFSALVVSGADEQGGADYNQSDGISSPPGLASVTLDAGSLFPAGQPPSQTHQNTEPTRQSPSRLDLPLDRSGRPPPKSAAMASLHKPTLRSSPADQPIARPAHSRSSRKSSLPARSSSSPPYPESRAEPRSQPTHTPVKASTSVPTEPPRLHPIKIHGATLDNSEISRLSPAAVGDYIVDPVGSRLTLGNEDTDTLDKFDYSGRLIDLQVTPAFGGLSDIKRGRITGTDTIVAIKVLRMKNMDGIEQNLYDQRRLRLRKRLARELRIWLFLHHPRILESAGFAFLDDQPCLLSPWCQNGNAKEYLVKNPSANRKTLVIQVAEGLIYLHSRNPAVVHADLKPLNILINDGGDAVICDFGISKFSGEANTGLTTSQDAFMSLRYAAPEILLNRKPTTKSDVYGFGCVALELFTDRCPQFGVSNTAALINLVINGPMSDPAHYPALSVTSPLWVLFRKCWATKPEGRPTMQEVHDELLPI